MTTLGDPLQRHDCTPDTARRCVRAAYIQTGDVVVEPGPGTGRITEVLLDAGATVHGIERDPQRIEGLKLRFARQISDGRFKVHAGDATQFMPEIKGPWKVVGNPPFQITSALLRHWLITADGVIPESLCFLLQREAVERLCGQEGSWSRWGVLLHLMGQPRMAVSLPRIATTPPSRVNLGILVWRKHEEVPTDIALVDRLLELAFAGPHTVIEALRGVATRTIIDRQAKEHGWNPREHSRMVPPAAWLEMARFLGHIGKLPANKKPGEKHRV